MPGEPTRIRTYISQGSKDYRDALLSKMSEELKLNKQELLDLLDGKMTRKEYEKILWTKGFIKKVSTFECFLKQGVTAGAVPLDLLNNT